MPWPMPVIRIFANACVTRFRNNEAADLKTILDSNYATLTDVDRTAVISYVQSIRPEIPYESPEASPG